MNAVAYHEARARLADAWAGSLVELDDCIFWIKLAIQRGEEPSQSRVVSYREQVRAVSQYEEQMTEQEIAFIKTGGDWDFDGPSYD